ncbi:MAG: alpha/beta hydrolase-fold protein [Acidobacteriota bacterium]
MQRAGSVETERTALLNATDHYPIAGTYKIPLAVKLLDRVDAGEERPDRMVEGSYQLRKDGYSRANGGPSNGGICEFDTAWHSPNEFSRVYSHAGAFTVVAETSTEESDGGHPYSLGVRREARKNLRVWLSIGTYDYEFPGGSFPVQNFQLANSLQLRGYDFQFRFGEGMHTSGHPSLDLPEMFAWLWCGYDSSKTHQEFEMEEAEKSQPFFRVKIANRNSW